MYILNHTRTSAKICFKIAGLDFDDDSGGGSTLDQATQFMDAYEFRLICCSYQYTIENTGVKQ